MQRHENWVVLYKPERPDFVNILWKSLYFLNIEPFPRMTRQVGINQQALRILLQDVIDKSGCFTFLVYCFFSIVTLGQGFNQPLNRVFLNQNCMQGVISINQTQPFKMQGWNLASKALERVLHFSNYRKISNQKLNLNVGLF